MTRLSPHRRSAAIARAARERSEEKMSGAILLSLGLLAAIAVSSTTLNLGAAPAADAPAATETGRTFSDVGPRIVPVRRG